MENAIVLGAGEVAAAIANARDAAVVSWWVARVEGAVGRENKRWGGGE